ncbi:MAG: class II glutamine amidotransferase [Candidatus Brocadiae bacterium]|nr:class II glutamine amidotransferase [Candidatus Brocadiia bacterium]
MCGIFGCVLTGRSSHLFEIGYSGLISLQHRGEECAGMAFLNPKENRIQSRKALGLVADVFREPIDCTGHQFMIGHVRFPTQGEPDTRNIQPFLYDDSICGPIALAHNGNIDKTFLKNYLAKKGYGFNATSDSELFLPLFLSCFVEKQAEKPEKAIYRALTKEERGRRLVRGAYSLLILMGGKIIAARDPDGYHPLVYGELPGKEQGYALASESAALEILGITKFQEVPPGTILCFDMNGIHPFENKILREQIQCRTEVFKNVKGGRCLYEAAFFVRDDSKVLELSSDAYHFRKNLGKFLAEKEKARQKEACLHFPKTLIAGSVLKKEEILGNIQNRLQYDLKKDFRVSGENRDFITKHIFFQEKPTAQSILETIEKENISFVFLDMVFQKADSMDLIKKLYSLRNSNAILAKTPIIACSQSPEMRDFKKVQEMMDYGVVVFKEESEHKGVDSIPEMMEKLIKIMVLPLQTNAIASALGYAQTLGCPLDTGIFINPYLGRIEIEPDEKRRKFRKRLQYHPISSAFEGRDIVIVQHSILDTDFVSSIVHEIRKVAILSHFNKYFYNFKEEYIRVHLRVAFPPFMTECQFGVFTPKTEDLYGQNFYSNVEEDQGNREMAKYFKVDSVQFLDTEKIASLLGDCEASCSFCITDFYKKIVEKYPQISEEDFIKARQDFKDILMVEINKETLEKKTHHQ